jgi:hypothetical protein
VASRRTELSLPLISHSGGSCSYEIVDLAEVVDAWVPPLLIVVDSASDSAVVPAVAAAAVVVAVVAVPSPLRLSGAPNAVSFAHDPVDAMLVVSRVVVDGGTASVVGGLVAGTAAVVGVGMKKGLFSVALADGATVGAGVADDAVAVLLLLLAVPAAESRSRALARLLGSTSPSSSTTVRVTGLPEVHAFLMRSTAARFVACACEGGGGVAGLDECDIGSSSCGGGCDGENG